MSVPTAEPGHAHRAILDSIFTSITDSLLVLDQDLVIVDANASLLDRLRREKQEVIGRRWADVFPYLAETGRAKDLRSVLTDGKPHRGRIPLFDAVDGAGLLFDVATYPVRDTATGQVTHLVEYAHEVTEEVKLQLQIIDANRHLLRVTEELEEKCAILDAMNTRLERLAVVDVMTDLPNHRAFQEQLTYEVSYAQRHRRPFSLILFDVDDFKKYNDLFGHPEGDLLLARMAQLMRASIRAVDLPARYGGEEFTILLPQTEKQGAALVAQRLRAAVEGDQFAKSPVTISLGIAEFPTDAQTASELVSCADKAMYQAKSHGKNSICLWNGEPIPAPRYARNGRPAARFRSAESGSVMVTEDDLQRGGLLEEGCSVTCAAED